MALLVTEIRVFEMNEEGEKSTQFVKLRCFMKRWSIGEDIWL